MGVGEGRSMFEGQQEGFRFRRVGFPSLHPEVHS